MTIVQYLKNSATILIPVLLIIGKIVKGFDRISDKWIPLILLPFGIIGAFIMLGFSFDSVIQGLLVTGTAVYGNQIFKQLHKDE